MKILKYFFLLILLTAVCLTLFIWSKDGKYVVENQIEIPLSQDKIQKFLIDPRNWESFNHNENLEKYSFEVEVDSNSRGSSQSLIKSIENVNDYESNTINQKIEWFEHEAESTWKFSSLELTTLVQWKCSGNLGFIEKCKALVGNSFENKINELQKKNLQKLKESLLKEYTHYELNIIGKETFKELFFLDKATNISSKKFLEDPIKNSVRFNQFLSNNTLELISPIGIQVPFFSFNSETVNCIITAWLKEEIFTTPESEIISSTKTNMHFLKIRMKGDYAHIEKAIQAGVEDAIKNEFVIEDTSNVILHFNTLYPNEGKPSAWSTDIYIPLKQNPIAELKLTD
jgi:hypothetical protein